MKQRKLFPADNQTVSCPDICGSSTCPYGCYPYTDSYPIPAPPGLIQEEEPSPNKPSHHISAFVIVIITLLASCFILVGYYVVVVKFCSWNPFRPRRRHPEGATTEEFFDENQGPEIDHPIWYIHTVGLQPSIINSITIFRYKRGESLIEGTDCSVCLNEFRNDETLRLLPKCNHAFHIPCIDTWLRSHTNCPVCRAGIISNAVATPVTSNGLTSNSMPRDVSHQMENSEIDPELNNSNQLRDEELLANRADTEHVVEFPQVDHDRQAFAIAKSSADHRRDGTLILHDCDFKDKGTMEDENYEIHVLRRSISVDSLVAANIGGAVGSLSVAEFEEILGDTRQDAEHDPEQLAGEKNSRLQGIIGGSSITQFLHEGPVRIKRSFSYDGRSILSRQYPRSNSILPCEAF